MVEAMKKGMFTDPLIQDIVTGPDSVTANHNSTVEMQDRKYTDIRERIF